MSNANVLRKQDGPEKYATINTYYLDDGEEIRWQAVGLLTYLLAKPDSWEFYVTDLINRHSNGRTSVQNALKELEEHGYLKREPKQDEKGRLDGYEWHVTPNPEDMPINGFPGKRVSRQAGNPTGGKSNPNKKQQQQPTAKTNKQGDNSAHESDGQQNDLDGIDWLLDLWSEQQPHEPSRQEKENQAKWAPKLLNNYERDELSEAVKGMNEMFKFSDEGWSLKKVDKNFTEARGAYNTEGDEGSDDKPVPSYMKKAN